MRHNAAIVFALGVAVSPAAAAANNIAKSGSGAEASWKPPTETIGVMADPLEQVLGLGMSPRPTEPPRLGRMMMHRADDYTLGPLTCGFVPTNGSK